MESECVLSRWYADNSNKSLCSLTARIACLPGDYDLPVWNWHAHVYVYVYVCRRSTEVDTRLKEKGNNETAKRGQPHKTVKLSGQSEVICPFSTRRILFN